MGRPRVRPDTINTPQRLLDAAESEFGQKGYDRTRLADIAEQAGISRPSLLYHYKSKDELYSAVVRLAFLRLGTAMADILTQEGTFEARIGRTVQLFADFLDTHKYMATMLLRELVDGRGPGRELLTSFGVPILDQIEKFAHNEGRYELGGKIPIRVALMQIVSGMVVRAASDSLREPLWGDETDYSSDLTKVLLKGI